jgi:hypothetical protein
VGKPSLEDIVTDPGHPLHLLLQKLAIAIGMKNHWLMDETKGNAGVESRVRHAVQEIFVTQAAISNFIKRNY